MWRVDVNKEEFYKDKGYGKQKRYKIALYKDYCQKDWNFV